MLLDAQVGSLYSSSRTEDHTLQFLPYIHEKHYLTQEVHLEGLLLLIYFLIKPHLRQVSEKPLNKRTTSVESSTVIQ